MRRLIFTWMTTAALAVGFIGAAVGCEKTIREPGESDHGGVFLHADAPPAPLPTTR
jgi:hypothetical protein